MKLSIEIAKTHLLAKKKQTSIAILGVTFGIAMFIAMIGLMEGSNQWSLDIAMTSTPHIRIYKDMAAEKPSILDSAYPDGLNLVHHQKPRQEKANLKSGFQMVSLLRQDPWVLGVSPQLTSQVFYNFGPMQLNGSIAGVDILEEDKLFDLRQNIIEGNLETLATTPDGIIMGSGLAKKLNVAVGDKVTLTTPQGFTMRLRITAIFQIGIGAVDNVKSYANIAKVQQILQENPKYITEIHLKLKDVERAEALALEYQEQFGYKAEDWKTANAPIFAGMVIRNVLTYAVAIALLSVSGFGIYNILNMTIYNKMKDIAILKATGFTAKDVMHIFMIQSLAIGVIGSTLGLLIGFFMSLGLSKVPFDAGDLASLDYLPILFDPKFYFIGVVFGIATTAMAGYFPAKRAGKIDPIEILRG